jgi:hypothetical protein
LIGAKIEVRLEAEPLSIARYGANVNDAGDRFGDLEIGDTVIHVTTAPTVALIEKCQADAASQKRPVIVTSSTRTDFARTLIFDGGSEGRVDVFDYEQFLALNVFEIGHFDFKGRKEAWQRIVDRYNLIVATVETDPGLRIVIA